MVHRHQFSLPSGEVSCLERGHPSPERPTLVLVHGLMGSAATFVPLLEALPATQHAVAIDLPGAGGSERSRTMNASLAAAAEWVRATLGAMNIERPVLVGHSHGGAVGLHLAASHPGTLRSLVLLSPAHPYFRHADQLITFYLSPLGHMFAHTMPWYPRWVQMVGLRQMAGPQSWDTPERLTPYRENLRVQGTIGHLLRLLTTWHSDMRELRQLLEAPFRLPALVIWGDHDRAVPVWTAPSLMRRLRRGHLTILAGVGHRPAEERPERCAELMERWLVELPALERRERISAAD